MPLALGLSGQRLLGVPIIVQPSHAERNRIASAAAAAMKAATSGATGPMRLYVGSLHYNITEEMLRGIFDPFGKVCPCVPLLLVQCTGWPLSWNLRVVMEMQKSGKMCSCILSVVLRHVSSICLLFELDCEIFDSI